MNVNYDIKNTLMEETLVRFASSVLLALASVFVHNPSVAQDYPSRPIS